jgi:hypothetical protein
MRTVLDKLLATLIATFLRRGFADGQALLIAHIGLTPAEQEALLSLRRRR